MPCKIVSLDDTHWKDSSSEISNVWHLRRMTTHTHARSYTHMHNLRLRKVQNCICCNILLRDGRGINARLRMAEIARTVTKTRFARFTSACRVFKHPSSFGTSVVGESRIPLVGEAERMQYSRRQPRRCRRLSRSHSFRNTIWYFEYFPLHLLSLPALGITY